MKGFPNQVADLTKLSSGIQTIVNLVDNGENARDDGVLGQALVYAGVAGTGHIPALPAEYIQQQLQNPISGQSFRTTARGLRELYRLFGFIEIDENAVHPTVLGREAAEFGGEPLDAVQIEFWRRAIANLEHFGGDAQSSHPYQVLLRLIGQCPGISRAKCALALEARDDSADELRRIVGLVVLSEDEIRNQIGATEANWNNAKKVLPKFAEQLGDVVKVDGNFHLAPIPGGGGAVLAAVPAVAPTAAEPAVPVEPIVVEPPAAAQPRTPRGSRQVTPETVGRAGTGEDFDDVIVPLAGDPDALAQGINIRRQRLRRHNLIVQDLAGRLAEMELHEHPFDLLAIGPVLGLLIEVKTLDGTPSDERSLVQRALSQLLYYEAFVNTPMPDEVTIEKIACFESPITEEHRLWLNKSEIGVIWKTEQGYEGDDRADAAMGEYLD